MTQSTSLNTGIPARDISYGVGQFIARTINYNTPNVGTAATVAVGTLPAGARVTRAFVYVETAFNAATTNELMIGTSADPDAFSQVADVNLAVAATTEIQRGYTLTFTSDTTVYVEYDQTGTAGTAGVAVVVIQYVVHVT